MRISVNNLWPLAPYFFDSKVLLSCFTDGLIDSILLKMLVLLFEPCLT